jgi:HK97 family phage major capsid protein
MSTAYQTAVAGAVRESLMRALDAATLLAPNSNWMKLCIKVDPADAIRSLKANRPTTGAAREASEELAKRQPLTEPNSVQIPWETIAYRRMRYLATRTDLAATSSAGGYLVETLNFNTAAQALLSMLVLGRLGATAIDATYNANINLPKVTASSTAYWQSTETTDVTESDETFGSVPLSPHTVGGYTELSRLLTLQSRPDAGDVVSNDLARKLTREIEKQALAGSGISGVPLGLANVSGINTTSGSSFALSTAMTAVTDIGDALDETAGWAANRTAASTLRQRAELTNSSITLWRGPLTWGTLADYPAGGTTGVGSGTAIFGAWRHLVLANWGGLQISVNPFAHFQLGVIGFRALATIDVAPVWPAAFTAVTSIT